MAEKIFGMDLGIASCGWAVIKKPTHDDELGEITDMGSWLFEKPEESDKPILKNAQRRGYRSSRHVIKRRAHRMDEIRQLFFNHKLIPHAGKDALHYPRIQPLEMRVKALDAVLEPEELAVALANLAVRRYYDETKHRSGTSSDDVADEDEKPKKRKKEEDSEKKKKQKMLSNIRENSKKLQNSPYRTLGEMLYKDPAFANHKRNRANLKGGATYTHCFSRNMVKDEVRYIFESQRGLGSIYASEVLETAFTKIAFRQQKAKNSLKMVGDCHFHPKEKRASKMAPSSELFRLLTSLNNLKIINGAEEKRLSKEELREILLLTETQASITYKTVRGILKLPKTAVFIGIKKEEDEKKDVAARSGQCMNGTHTLKKILGKQLWEEAQNNETLLDDITNILTFHYEGDEIIEKLITLNVDQAIVNKIKQGINENAFSAFSGTMHLSSKAMRQIIPHLYEGMVYSEACEAAGYNHSENEFFDLPQVNNKKSLNKLICKISEKILNPVARKATVEAIKQLNAMVHRYGLPNAIHVEMSREISRTQEQKEDKLKENRKNETNKNECRKDIAHSCGINVENVTGKMIERHKLWHEQTGMCLYTQRAICYTDAILGTSERFRVEVDHILPRSRFALLGFDNLMLASAQANQEKGNRTPYEWIMETKGQEEWDKFVAQVQCAKELKYKQKHLFLKNAKTMEGKFLERHLNDTRYICKTFANAARCFYPLQERHKAVVRARPARIIALLRGAWGLEKLKKNNGERLKDARHHAIDALVTACTTERELQKLTDAFKIWEKESIVREMQRINPPWGDRDSFRAQVQESYNKILVARAERRRARGEGHEATIKKIRIRDGKEIVYDWKSLFKITEKDLSRIKDAHRNQAMIDAILVWIDKGKPKDDLPKVPAGHIIKKVQLISNDKPAVILHNYTEKPDVEPRPSTAKRGAMVRLDIFTKPNKKGKDEFYFIPIYAHQIMNKKKWPNPPMCLFTRYKNEDDWQPLDETYQFKFSLYKRSFIELADKDADKDKVPISGYYTSFNINNGVICLKHPYLTDDAFDKNIAGKTLLYIKKFYINRFGEKSEIKSEKRTWHGVVCTSPDQQS